MMCCEITFKVSKWRAWAVAYALVPLVALGVMTADRASGIAARFIRITTTTD